VCRAWKEKEVFTKSKKDCDDCLLEYERIHKTIKKEQKEQRWIGMPEFIKDIEEKLKAKEITDP
jgi:hypothetical protein